MVIVDVHVHLVHEEDDIRPGIGLQTPEMLLEVMDRLGIQTSVVFGVPGVWDHAHENELVYAAASKYPKRLVPVGLVNPRRGRRAIDEARRCIKELGFKGIKVRPDSHCVPANCRPMHALVDECASLNVPLLIHSGRTHWSHPLTIGDLARDHPGAKILMQHMFDITGKYAIGVAKRNPHLYVETASHLSPFLIREMVAAVGSQRVMFASDSPPLETEIELLNSRCAGLSAEDEVNVLGRTAVSYWGLREDGYVQ